MGFEIVDGKFLNEDGDPNAKAAQVASWLNQFYTDHSKTNTGLDRIPNLIMADGGLASKITERGRRVMSAFDFWQGEVAWSTSCRQVT